MKRTFILTLFVLPTALLLAATVQAREKWPQPTDAEKVRIAGFKQHEQEVLAKIKTELAEWARKGKPFYNAAMVPGDLPQANVPAFPSAEGAGAYTCGGRGGKVFVVTNLADSGPGTFREACEAAGPRIVIFNVAGVIHLEKPIFIEAPYITIAGQTAPGDGVCVAGETTLVDTHDVVIRYMRFRRGNTNVFDRDDALGGNPIGNIIVDHCSASWGLDENLSMYRHMYSPPSGGKDLKLPTLNLTIQWCVSSEALDTYNHAFGGTWGGFNTSFHHNLFACNTGRNPSIGYGRHVDFRNNVLFNWRHRTVDGGDAGSWVNVVANYYKPGPAVNEGAIGHRICLPQHLQMFADGKTPGQWYVADNEVVGDPKVTANNWDGGVQYDDGDIKAGRTAAELEKQVRGTYPGPYVPVTQETASQAYQLVLDRAGALLPCRDAVDKRVIEEVKTGSPTYKEGIITDISQVGGYPEYNGQPEKNLGPDGIPLWWKEKYGLDTNDLALATKDLQGDGYTVMDKYLGGLDPTKKIDWINPLSRVNHLTENSFKP